MAWTIDDYNLNKMSKKSDAHINKEYTRLRNIVERRLKTFEKHKVNPHHVAEARQTIQGNESRRDKEHAIMEMKRFLNLDTSSYSAYNKARLEGLRTWKGFGITGLTGKNIQKFFDFLEWVKSFTGGKYEINAIKQAWEDSGHNVEAAMDIFEEMLDDGL